MLSFSLLLLLSSSLLLMLLLLLLLILFTLSYFDGKLTTISKQEKSGGVFQSTAGAQERQHLGNAK